MAPTRRLEQDAQHSSSDEEEESSRENGAQEESESEEDEEEEDKTSPPTPPKDKKSLSLKKPEPTLPSAQTHQSSSSEESESESESDKQIVPSRRADPTIKPISSKPMEETPKATTKPRSKPSGAKRPLEEKSKREEKDSKRAKKKVADVGVEEDVAKKSGGDEAKKQLFQRLWSEEDEIAVLKGMIEYMAKKGADPIADMNAFHDFIRSKLHIDVTKTQMTEKVRRLKKKYENNSSKGKKGGQRNITKPHEQKAYELSKKIWGVEGDNVGLDSPKANGKEKKNQNLRSGRAAATSPKLGENSGREVKKEEIKLDEEQKAKGAAVRLAGYSRGISESGLEAEIMRDGLELIPSSKRLELEEKWKQLRMQEYELYLKKVELVREQTKLAVAALKSAEN